MLHFWLFLTDPKVQVAEDGFLMKSFLFFLNRQRGFRNRIS